jgi:hypothetical protein
MTLGSVAGAVGGGLFVGLALVWGAAATMLPALRIAPPPHGVAAQ